MENNIFLKLESSHLANKTVLVAVPEKDLDRSVSVFKERGMTVTQLDIDEINNMNLDEVEMIDPIRRKLPDIPLKLPDPDMPIFYNDKHIYYDNPKCQRCANRYRLTDFCRKHSADTENCYRFKLEK